MPDYEIVASDDIQVYSNTQELQGAAVGLDVSIIVVDMPPGAGVRLHRHRYRETFVVQQGTAEFRVGAEIIEVQAPRILIVEAGVAHGFRNTGSGRLRQVDIHHSPTFITEWLEPERT